MTAPTSGSALLAGNPTTAPAAPTGGDPAAAPPAPAGTPPAAPAGTPPASGAPASWLDGITDPELRGYAEVKGWKDPLAVLDGYRNLEKLVGLEKLPMPKGPDDAEGLARVYDALGRPKSADEYKLPVPEGAPTEFATAASKVFHEAGLSAAQATKVAEWYNGQVQAQVAAQTEAFQRQTEQQLAALRTEWGAAFEQQVEIGRRAVREFGLGEQLGSLEQALGTAGLLKLMTTLGAKLGEDTFEAGQGGAGGAMTPAAAQARIAALKADPDWSARYLKGGAAERAELEKLMTFAYPK